MRRLVTVCTLVASVSAVQLASQSSGKIPITTRSADARALFLRARALNETLEPHEAHTLFAQALAADRTFAMAEYYLASTAPTAKELTEHLERAIALSSNASPGERLVILGMQARRHADPARARQLAESLVALYPRDERAHSGLAILYSSQQQYPKAIAEYSRSIEINPEYAIAYNQLGYAYRSIGNMASAETAFKYYIAHLPNDPNPYDSYAELLMKTGRFDESIAQYRKALSIDPNFTGSHVGIAANEMLAGRHGAAIAELERFVNSARDDNERRTALVNEAYVYVDKGETDKAVQAMERSYAIARTIGDTASMSADGIAIGDVLLEAGRASAASEQYQRAHAIVAVSGVSDEVKRDDGLGRLYDAARVALARHDVDAARRDAAAYLSGATERKNDARVRQAHELNGLVALAAKQTDASLAELKLADQENPAVVYAIARAHASHGATAKANEMTAEALHMNILPTFPYVFTRAAVAAATRSASSENAHGRPR